ncbi:hypothetical protein HGRIS_004773 [Hohenbuehelia grisea]|uniref:RanBP2-type domain-containing protein n=1 Tax=Hohenbuehelia grisea TaxID=104357 RepID=A0ABR3JDL1_9AGAR
MSAARSSSARKARRQANSLPYGRPPPKKEESWLWLKKLSNIMTPSFLKSSPPPESSSESEDSDGPDDEPVIAVTTPSVNLVSRGQEIEDSMNKLPQIPPPPCVQQSSSRTLPAESPATPPPSTQSARHTLASFPPPASPSDSLRAIEEFLRGQTTRVVEVDSILSYIQISPKDNKPFRFETPLRGSSHASGSSHGQTTSLPSLSTSKTLPKNPNGTSFWRGGGSAKRPRNRFYSPAFGPPRASPDRLKLSVSKDVPSDPRADSKRRRVGEDSTTSVATPSGAPVHASTPPPQPRASAPGPSPTRAAQAVPFPVSSPLSPSPTTVNGSSNLPPTTPSRLRIPQKPTAPAIPSPLRQTWGQSANDSSPESSPQPQRQTKAASFMAELIKDATPPKKPDLSNPYQTASPVKTPARPRPKRPRATGKPTTPAEKAAKEKNEDEKMLVDPSEKDKAKEKPLEEYSPQAIIEATLPKGSKRSRPIFDAPQSPTPETQAPDDMVDRRSPKRSKADESDTSKSTDPFGSNKGFSAFAPSTPSPSKPPATAFELPPPASMPSSPAKDATKPSIIATPPSPSAAAPSGSSTSSSVPVATPLSPTLNKSVFGAPKTSSIPKEPSKLRFSYQPEPTTTPPADAPISGLPPTPKLAPAQISGLPFTTAGMSRTPTLPDISNASSHNKEDDMIARLMASPMLAVASSVFKIPPVAYNMDPAHVRGREIALAMSEEELPKFEWKIPVTKHNMDPAHVRAREAAMAIPLEELYKYFPTSSSTSREEAEKKDEKKADSAKPAAPTAPPPVAFNWGAVGIKAPGASSGASWTCSTCMLSNPATATDKCTVCDSPR